ncbi:MAG: hypothetical protein IKT79_08950, partial [Akkermansia sp.]|nr:hypothetical protein [Akkermansia sp.]
DLDAKSVFISHIVNANQNRKYTKMQFSQAWVNVHMVNDEAILTIDDGAMIETGTIDISIAGEVKVGMRSANNQWNDLPVSGMLSYSLPKKVLNSEYKGGAIDPIFEPDPKNDLRCVFKTNLSGVSIMPQDDSRAQVEATAQVRSTLARAEGMYDVDAIPDVLKSDDTAKEGESNPENDIFMKDEDKKSDEDIFGVKKEDEDDIFKRNFETVPADSSIKF